MPDTVSFSLDDDVAADSAESAAIIESMPEPQQHAIDAANETAADTGDTHSASAGSGESDADNTAWNPELHATGADGKGVRTAKGTWRKRRGVAKRTSTVAGRSSVNAASTAGPTPDALAAQARAAGAAAAASVFMLGRALGGEDWTPRPDEIQMQTEAWGNYFVAKNITDFPPGMALSIAVLGYAGPRFFTPATRERAGRVKHWLALRVAKWRVKRALKARGVDAVVTIKGSKSANTYDSILIDGKPFNEFVAEKK